MLKANDYATKASVNVTYGIFGVNNFGRNFYAFWKFLLWLFEIGYENCN